MPRTLPWLSGASKKDSKTSASTSRVPKKRSSSPDRLVNSDLDDLDPPKRNHAPKKRRQREPSSSPPPASAPEVVYMNEGLNGDDIYVMVEDEFYSTAQLFTAPLHRAAYDRLKRLHRSRGEETLANIERATDGMTKVGTALRMKMEAQERAKKRKKSVGIVEDEESDDDDEYMAVPELAGLMTSSQVVGGKTEPEDVVKAKSNTRAAAGFLQSPNKGNKKKDVFAKKTVAPVEEDESTDDDDLDVGTPKTAASRAYKDVDSALNKPRRSIEKPQEVKSMGSGFFRQFAKPVAASKSTAPEPRKAFDSSPERKEPALSRELSSTPAANGAVRRGGGGKGSRMAEFLAKRRQATQALESDEESKPELVKPQRLVVKETPIKQEVVSPIKSNGAPNGKSNDSIKESKSSDYLARKAACEKEAQDKRKNTQRDDIPTFLF